MCVQSLDGYAYLDEPADLEKWEGGRKREREGVKRVREREGEREGEGALIVFL